MTTVVSSATTQLVKNLSSEKEVKSLEQRIGNIDPDTNKRAVRKIEILKALAYKDGEMSLEEKNFLVKYILKSNDLPSDVKIVLALDLDVAPSGSISDFMDQVLHTISSTEIFKNEEESAGFVTVMMGLAHADGHIDDSEVEYINQVCDEWKVPKYLLPDQFKSKSN